MTASIDRLHVRLQEAYADLYHNFIDPLEPLCDDGERWLALGGDGDALSSLNGAGSSSAGR